MHYVICIVFSDPRMVDLRATEDKQNRIAILDSPSKRSSSITLVHITKSQKRCHSMYNRIAGNHISCGDFIMRKMDTSFY